MAGDSMTSSTYVQRPYHAVLVCSVVVCLLLVSVGLTVVTWYTVTSRHDNESTSVNVTDEKVAPLVTGYDLHEVMQALWDKDVSRIPETDYVLNLQSKTNVSNKIDMADSSLFSNMLAHPQTVSTTYRAFLPLVDNYVATVRQADTPTMQQREEIDSFLNAVVDTTVMQEAHVFLRYKGHAEESRASFKDLLYRVWFEPYPRSPRYNTTDSSGFEHVFVGEARRRKVIGFHSWLQFFLGEKDSTIDYRGYIRIQEPRLISVQFTWHGRQKRLASFFVGTSPEFDMAVYTVCLLTRPNKLCQFEINYFPVRIRTWDVSHVPGLQIGSAYPELLTR